MLLLNHYVTIAYPTHNLTDSDEVLLYIRYCDAVSTLHRSPHVE